MARNTATAGTAKAPKKPFKLSDAEQADGAMPHEGKSAYEICGVRDRVYREKSLGAYQTKLRDMELVELHDHAYEMAVLPSQSREVTVERLEERFLKENPGAAREAATGRAASRENESIEAQAARILARGR